MKKQLTWLLILILTSSITSATINERSYLKIKLSNQNEISYPPGTGFIAEDKDGNTILNHADLVRLVTFDIVKPITLFVFVYWKEKPDVYELSSGKLILGKTNKVYKSVINDYRKIKRGRDNSNFYDAWKGDSKGVSLKRERYFDYDAQTGYDVSLEFTNGVIFYYRDGKAAAWENGKLLKIKGNFLIETSTGIIKLSYNPADKELWWVFEKSN